MNIAFAAEMQVGILQPFRNRLGSSVEVNRGNSETLGAETQSAGILKANVPPLEAHHKPRFTLGTTKM